MTVAELMHRMTEAEFRDWQTFHSQTPLDTVSNHHWTSAQICATLANVNRAPNTASHTASEFLLIREEMDLENILLRGEGW